MMRADYQKTLDELSQLRDKHESLISETTTIKPIVFSKYGWLYTSKVRWLSVMLGKGDRFEGRIVISIRVGTETDWSYEPGGAIIFSVQDPRYTKLIDAGRIQDEYSHEFVAEESGDYKLIFNDPTIKSRVELFYNCSTTIQ